tara:strand:- start:467 stop:604 length:138 start_codon:yes stop_codon:yes gene_type:complete
MEDGGSHWYEDKKKETIKEEETHPKGWYWCPERRDYFRYKEWLKL